MLAEKDLWRSSSSASHLEWVFCQHWIWPAVALSRQVCKTSKDEDTTTLQVGLPQGCTMLLRFETPKVQFDAFAHSYIIYCYQEQLVPVVFVTTPIFL